MNENDDTNPGAYLASQRATFNLRAELTYLQNEIKEWKTRNFPNSPAVEQLIGVMEELGELSHAYLKKAQGIRVNEAHVEKMQDAVGDITVFLINFCNEMGFSYANSVMTAWGEVRQRDWQKNKTDGKV